MVVAVILCIPFLGELIETIADIEIWTTVSFSEKAIVLVSALIISTVISGIPAAIDNPVLLRGIAMVITNLLIATLIKYESSCDGFDLSEDLLGLFGDIIAVLYCLSLSAYVLCAICEFPAIIGIIAVAVPAALQVVYSVMCTVHDI